MRCKGLIKNSRAAGQSCPIYASNASLKPALQEPIKDPARLEWHEATKVAHYYLSTRPMEVREDEAPYGEDR